MISDRSKERDRPEPPILLLAVSVLTLPVLAVLRNLVLALLRNAGWTNIAAALREHAWHQPHAALRLLGIHLV